MKEQNYKYVYIKCLVLGIALDSIIIILMTTEEAILYYTFFFLFFIASRVNDQYIPHDDFL